MYLYRVFQMYVADHRMPNVGHFGTEYQDDAITIVSNAQEELTLELIYQPKGVDKISYMVSYIKVPKKMPLKKLVIPKNLQTMYEGTKNVLELQELAMVPVYVNEFSQDPVKPTLIKSVIAPNKLKNNSKLIALLTSYGCCTLASKATYSNHWGSEICDVSDFLIKNLCPAEKTHCTIKKCKEFKEFKEYIDKFWITTITWDLYAGGKHILFVGTASGDIFAINYNEKSMLLEKYSQLETNMGRLVYMKNYGDLLLASSKNGAVSLFKIMRNKNFQIEKVISLWRKTDRISCHLAVIKYLKNLNVTLVIFCKSSHVLYCLVSPNDKILAKGRICIDEIKVTGLISINDFEYIASTLTGKLIRIQLGTSNCNNFHLQQDPIKCDLDGANFQILGLASTRNSNLLTLLLYRNKEYKILNKKQKSSILLESYSFHSPGVLQKHLLLINETMDNYLDFVVKLRLDILNNNKNTTYYHEYVNSCSELKHSIFNDNNLKALQIKYIICLAFSEYEKLQFSVTRKQTAFQIEILKHTIEIIHIICRLQYLSKFQKFSDFQKSSAVAMIKKFKFLNERKTVQTLDKKLSELNSNTQEDSNNKLSLKMFMEEFIQAASIEMETLCARINIKDFYEKCLQCNEQIVGSNLVCSQSHKLSRCCVSLIQVPYFNDRHCSNCNIPAVSNDQDLQEVFSPDEPIKCTFCRFTFVRKDFFEIDNTDNS